MLRFLLYVSVFTLVLGQFSNILKNSGLHIYLFDVIVGIFAISGIIYFYAKKKLIIPTLIFPFIIFIFWAAITLIKPAFVMNSEDFLLSVFYLIRFIIYLSSGLVVFNMLDQKIITLERLLFVLVFSGVFLSLAGFVQLIFLPDFETLDPLLGWDPHKFRLASTFFDPNFAGGYIAICLALTMHSIFVLKEKKAINLVFFGILLIALFLTFSRSAWASFAVIVLIFGLFKTRLFLILALILAFSAYFAVPRVQTRLAGITDPSDSAHFRLISWKNTLNIAQDNLLFGTGYNTFRYAQIDYGYFDAGTYGGHSGAGSDSSFLLVLATTGIPGFILFTSTFIGPPLYLLFKRRPLGLVLSAVFAGIIIQSQFINAVFFPQIMFLWITLLVAALYVSNSEFLG